MPNTNEIPPRIGPIIGMKNNNIPRTVNAAPNPTLKVGYLIATNNTTNKITKGKIMIHSNPVTAIIKKM